MTSGRVIKVTRSEVNLAKVLISLADARGETVDPAYTAIAEARTPRLQDPWGDRSRVGRESAFTVQTAEVVPEPPNRVGLLDALRVGEYRALFLAHVLSVCGDQVARVALGILVFDRTHSPLLSGLTYALSYLPWLVGASLLCRLGDLHPRRRVLVGSDVARLLLVGAMALPGMPLAPLMVLMAAVSMVAPPFEAARSALLPDLLDEEHYYAAAALTNVTTQVATVVGLGCGGAVVGLVSASGALALDAGTFAASAVIVLLGVRPRPAAVVRGVERAGRGGWRVVARTPVLRTLVLLACLASAFGTVPEGLAVVLARHLHAGDAAVGPLSAALPLGAVLGSLVLARFVPVPGRRALLFPLAALSTAPLLVGLVDPGLPLLVSVLVLAGAGTAYNIPAAAAFVRAAPDVSRARVMGLAQASLAVSQGVGIAVAAAAAERLSPTTVVGVSGACGLACVLLLERVAPAELLNSWTRSKRVHTPQLRTDMPHAEPDTKQSRTAPDLNRVQSTSVGSWVAFNPHERQLSSVAQALVDDQSLN